jgi:hypothetical protein
MTRFVVGDDRSQSTLFPERLDDYLGEDNPIRANHTVQQDAPPCGVAPWSLWFRLTLLLASLTGMATTIIAKEGARWGVVGMIELGA